MWLLADDLRKPGNSVDRDKANDGWRQTKTAEGHWILKHIDWVLPVLLLLKRKWLRFILRDNIFLKFAWILCNLLCKLDKLYKWHVMWIIAHLCHLIYFLMVLMVLMVCLSGIFWTIGSIWYLACGKKYFSSKYQT